MEKFTPEQITHICALMAWNGKTAEEAKKIVLETPYEQLDGITYAEDSINTAKEGIKLEFGEGTIEANKENYAKVINILEKIHDKWVKGNAKKYSRGDFNKANKNLFQHTPLALIGLSETAKDLMFLAPFLKKMGLETGEMKMEPWGNYMPNNEITKAYTEYVKNYLKENNIKTEKDLAKHIRDCLNGGYAPLNREASEMATKRADYMNDNMGILVKNILKNNPVISNLVEKEIEE